jgi:hypothetical protein
VVAGAVPPEVGATALVEAVMFILSTVGTAASGTLPSLPYDTVGYGTVS